jgi:hypothetical protein
MNEHDYVFVVGLSFGFFAGLGLGVMLAFYVARMEKQEKQQSHDPYEEPH